MKKTPAIIVFLSLIIPSILFGCFNYSLAKDSIIEDMNQALAKTLLYEKLDKITPDTLRVFKSNLQIAQLKKTSYLSLCTDEPSKLSLCSDTISYKIEDERLYIRAYPNCSKATIFSVSEQTIPGCLFFISIFWGISSLIYFYKQENSLLASTSDNEMVVYGNLFFSTSSEQFYNEKNEIIYFTPMQLSLMKLLMINESKKVSINDICQNLWPKKENARESLYTLMRRLKPIVERNSNVKIITYKNGHYGLSTKKD